ncbi:MAG: ferredoxin [Gammaproteobacteria bacterium]|jgi:ferredoxin|nr:ferredoxin [Gammaproteobacteria bacterium]
MPHVVTDNCRLCLFTDCVQHCPVQCFHADDERSYIDPDVCIDCGACIPACPVQAIHEVFGDEQRELLALNAERSHALPVISVKRTPLPSAPARQAELGF